MDRILSRRDNWRTKSQEWTFRSCLFHSCDFVHHCPGLYRTGAHFQPCRKKRVKSHIFLCHASRHTMRILESFILWQARWTAAAGGLVSSVEASKQLVFLRQRARLLGSTLRRGVGRPTLPSDGLTASISRTRPPGCRYQQASAFGSSQTLSCSLAQRHIGPHIDASLLCQHCALVLRSKTDRFFSYAVEPVLSLSSPSKHDETVCDGV